MRDKCPSCVRVIVIVVLFQKLPIFQLCHGQSRFQYKTMFGSSKVTCSCL